MTRLFITAVLAIVFLGQAQAQWVLQTTPLLSTDQNNFVYFANTQNGWVGGKNGKVIRTTNGGGSWSTVSTGTSERLTGFAMSGSTALMVGTSGSIVRSTDGGATWASVTSGTTNWLLSVSFADANTVWAVGGSRTVLKSVNGGVSWEPITNLNVASSFTWLYSVNFVNSTTGWVVGESGTVRYTTDGGATWSTQVASGFLYGASFPSASVGWISELNGKVYRTTDAGTTWQLVNTITGSPGLEQIVAFDANEAWICGGSSSKVFHTTDGGATWSQEQLASTWFHGLAFPSRTEGWVVGETQARVYKYTAPPACSTPLRALAFDPTRSTGAVVRFGLNPDSTAGVDSIAVRWRTVGNTTWTSGQWPAANLQVASRSNATHTAYSYNIQGLIASTAYEWQARTSCTNGADASWQSGANFTTQAAGSCPQPSTPTNQGVTSSSVAMRWNVGATVGVDKYRIFYRTWNGSQWVNMTGTEWRSTPQCLTCNRTLSGLTANTLYLIQVMTICTNGEAVLSPSGLQVRTSVAQGGRVEELAPESAPYDETNDPELEQALAQFAQDTKAEVLAARVAVAPNPTAGLFTISGLQGSEILTLRNALGQVVTTTTASEAQTTLDLSAQPAGIYLLQVAGSSNVQTVRVVKQ